MVKEVQAARGKSRKKQNNNEDYDNIEEDAGPLAKGHG